MDLNAVLKLAQSQSDESNPFSPVNDVTSQLGQAVIQGAPKMGTKDSLIAGLISGLASGFTKNLTSGYSNRQADFANQVLFGGASARPSGMDESVFNTMRNARSIFDREQTMAIEAENRKAQNDIKKDIVGKFAGGVADNPYAADEAAQAFGQYFGPMLGIPQQPRPVAERAAPTEAAAPTATPNMQDLLRKYKGDQTLARDELKRLEETDRLTKAGLGSVAGLPSGVQSNALSQQVTAKENSNVETFIDQQFEKAKGISSLSALAPNSTAGKELEGIGISMTTALQKALGREMNAKEQERLGSMVPTWRDTKDQIEMKRTRFKDLMQTIAGATPLANQIGNAPQGVQMPNATGEIGVPQGAKPTGRYAGGKPVYEVNGQLWISE